MVMSLLLVCVWGVGDAKPVMRKGMKRKDNLAQIYPLEKGMAAHSSILAWRIPWTEESMGLQRIGHT